MQLKKKSKEKKKDKLGFVCFSRQTERKNKHMQQNSNWKENKAALRAVVHSK